MEITISIKADNGDLIALRKSIVILEDKDIIGSIESEVSAVRHELLPLLSSTIVEQHQKLFRGEKNKEKKRK
jgi:folate-dependent phosphoribosylglycinamide formyltransferase PurN